MSAGKFGEIFPSVNYAQLVMRLRKPEGIVDVVLDTDTYNEIDDQFALAYLIRSEKECRIRAITAAPFYSDPLSGRVRRSSSPSDGMERSYNEILKVLELLDRNDLRSIVYRGSRSYLTASMEPVESEAALKIVEISKAYSTDNPLYVVAIGAITNVASALLIDPTLRDRIMIVWLGGHAHHWANCADFNMIQDIDSARVVFGCGVPLVQLPCLGVVSEFRFCRAEFEQLFRDKNELCNYLIDNTYEFIEKDVHFEHWSKPLWDVTAVAWLFKGDFMLDRIVPSPIPQHDYSYSFDPNRHPILYVYYIKKDPLVADLVAKLTT